MGIILNHLCWGRTPPPPNFVIRECNRQGEVRVKGGLSAWRQTHTECFMQERNAGTHNWHRETESGRKRPRQAGPGVLQGVQDLIAELVAKGYGIV